MTSRFAGDRPVTVFEPVSLATLHPLARARQLPRHAELLRALSVHRLSVRYKQTRLGLLWAVLQPLAIMLAFALVFALVGSPPSEGIPYALFAYAALVPWTAFASGLANGAGSLTGHASLITKVAFPRELLPVTYVVAAIVDALLASVVLGGLMAWYAVPPTPALLWAPVALALLAVWLTGTSLLLSAVNVRHRDVALAVPVLLQVWMFVTPVVYPLSLARQQLPGLLSTLYTLNPMAGIIDTFRRSTVLGLGPDLPALLLAAAVSLLLLPLAYVYFKHAEQTMADVA